MTGTELYEALSFGTEDLSKHAQTAVLWLTGSSQFSTVNTKVALVILLY